MHKKIISWLVIFLEKNHTDTGCTLHCRAVNMEGHWGAAASLPQFSDLPTALRWNKIWNPIFFRFSPRTNKDESLHNSDSLKIAI